MITEEYLVLALACILVGAVLFYKLSRWWQGFVVNRRLKRGVKVECRMHHILSQNGYQLITEQKKFHVSIYIDGEERRYELRPDGIAKKDGKEYAVEVKSGRVAKNPLYKETRRQLLEYFYGLPLQGVLLVDAEQFTVHEIEFPRESFPLVKKPHRLLWLGFGIIFGSLITYILTYYGCF